MTTSSGTTKTLTGMATYNLSGNYISTVDPVNAALIPLDETSSSTTSTNRNAITVYNDGTVSIPGHRVVTDTVFDKLQTTIDSLASRVDSLESKIEKPTATEKEDEWSDVNSDTNSQVVKPRVNICKVVKYIDMSPLVRMLNDSSFVGNYICCIYNTTTDPYFNYSGTLEYLDVQTDQYNIWEKRLEGHVFDVVVSKDDKATNLTIIDLAGLLQLILVLNTKGARDLRYMLSCVKYNDGSKEYNE